MATYTPQPTVVVSIQSTSTTLYSNSTGGDVIFSGINFQGLIDTQSVVLLLDGDEIETFDLDDGEKYVSVIPTLVLADGSALTATTSTDDGVAAILTPVGVA